MTDPPSDPSRSGAAADTAGLSGPRALVAQRPPSRPAPAAAHGDRQRHARLVLRRRPLPDGRCAGGPGRRVAGGRGAGHRRGRAVGHHRCAGAGPVRRGRPRAPGRGGCPRPRPRRPHLGRHLQAGGGRGCARSRRVHHQRRLRAPLPRGGGHLRRPRRRARGHAQPLQAQGAPHRPAPLRRRDRRRGGHAHRDAGDRRPHWGCPPSSSSSTPASTSPRPRRSRSPCCARSRRSRRSGARCCSRCRARTSSGRSGQPPRQRGAGTLATIAHLGARPGHLYRVHDLGEAAAFLTVLDERSSGRTVVADDLALPVELRREPPPAT